MYKTTDYYAPQAEGCIRWDDPAVGIEWPAAGMPIVIAAKDAAAPGLNALIVPALADPA